MTTQLDGIPSDCTLQQAAQKMASSNVGTLPVFDKTQKGGQGLLFNGQPLLGIITDRDIVTKGLAQGKNLQTPVKDILTPNLVCVSEESELKQASQLMAEKDVRRILVTDKDQKTCKGILSLTDLALSSKDPQLVLQTINKMYGH